MRNHSREEEAVVSIQNASLVYQGDKAQVMALQNVDLDIKKR